MDYLRSEEVHFRLVQLRWDRKHILVCLPLELLSQIGCFTNQMTKQEGKQRHGLRDKLNHPCVHSVRH